ncbi:Hypothetical protein FKW44_003960 [Caligus rogercresseyi]|uniref:Uncharacterized protein n=1 Tax=Caligus rogercresseyi TaxID=217165 RepID=A0A7T8HKY8_CALRO|nr:Hypothetical protein FKW44_003960 [Caligus rogercresseyi]
MGKPATAVRDCTASVEAAAKTNQNDHALRNLRRYRGACTTVPRAATSLPVDQNVAVLLGKIARQMADLAASFQD